MAEPDRGQQRASPAFLLAYALAWCGGSIAYVPFLTILLPVRIEQLVGPDASIAWLAYLAFAGAVAASSGNIAFGYLSDVTRTRRAWIALGLVLSSLLLTFTSRVETFAGLMAAIVMWQLALNMMLAPLAAWAGDRVPHGQKGLLGGMLAFAPAAGALSGTAVTWLSLASAEQRLALVVGAVICCVVPVLLIGGGPSQGPGTEPVAEPGAHDEPPRFASSPLVRRMWLARLAVQIAEAALFAYLYLWFRSVDPAMDGHHVARVFSTVLLLSAPLALLVGHWADRHGKPLLPLPLAACLSCLGLIGMALSQDLVWAIAAYGLFGIASAIFLALHSAQTLRVLPRSDRRGRDLGLFNLTNTVPSLIMPWLVLMLVPQFGYAVMFALLAALALVAALMLFRLPHRG